MKSLLMMAVALLATGSPCAQNTDCLQAIQVCNDASFSGNSGGCSTQELPNNNTTDGCLTVEHQSSWYYFIPVTSGTVEFTIQTSVDYDFAIWTDPCSNLGSPVRCSYSANYGDTGLGNSALEISEGSGGDMWVAPLSVTAGQTYMLLIDNFTASNTPFTIAWNLYDGTTLNCTPVPLPIELLTFTGDNDPQYKRNILAWQTATEIDNDFFTVERSKDGMNWAVIHTADGAHNSQASNSYEYEDIGFDGGRVNYYRLSQTNINGVTTTYGMISIDNTHNTKKVVTMMNLVGQKVPDDTKGMVIVIYEDGDTQREFRQ